MDATCGNCRFWDGGFTDDIGCGDCHRRPPSVPLVDYVTGDGVEVHLRCKAGDVVYVTWPRTCDDDWCGEWEPDEDTRLKEGLY